MLENEIIKLRALETTDIDALFDWENDPENWRISHTLTPYSRHVLIDYVHNTKDIYTDKQLRLIVVNKSDGKLLGNVDLFDCDFKNRRAGIGILIAKKENRGKGLASQILDILLPYCFNMIGFHQMYCNILADNQESIGLFKKFGFETVGLKRDWNFYNGQYANELLLQKINLNG